MLWKYKPSPTWDRYNPTLERFEGRKDDELAAKNDELHAKEDKLPKVDRKIFTHGAKVLDLLTGATNGAAKACTVYTVGRDMTMTNKPNWASSLTAVAKHFEDLKKKNLEVQAIMKLSLAMDNISETRVALEKVIAAGIVVVGAAGNEGVSRAISPTIGSPS